MNFVAKHKQAFLHSVSHAALRFGYAAATVARAERKQNGVHKSGIEGFLIWLRIWLDWLSGKDQAATSFSQQGKDREVNRHRRRMKKRRIPIARLRYPLYNLCGKGLSITQFLELECALSLHGRINVYSLRYFGSVLQRRALLVCYDHGWWRAPIGKMGYLCCGMWRVHLWPEWKHIP